jgi:RNA polymerase sigma-70 factor (ECF subfamily)
LQIAEAFFRASREGDLNTLGTLLTADVSLHADGGGKRPAVAEPILGYEAVMAAMERLAALVLKNRSTLIRTVYINGLPGFITLEADGQYQTTALDTDGEKIAGIYVVRNPDKLKHL